MVTVLWGGASDAGVSRTLNEDSMLCESPIFAVADGMGGGPAGGQASEIAITALRQCAGGAATRADAVLAAVNAANDAILGVAARTEANHGMGTTVVGLALVEDAGVEHWLAFNVGDSRLYRLAGAVFEQITVDHSEVQELIAQGRLAPEDRAAHPQAHVITRVLGTAPPPEADCWLLYPVPGERFLLCSDGLVGELSDEHIRGLLRTEAPPAEIARMLVDEAVRAGAADNVTAVVVDVAGAVADEEPVTGPRQRSR